MALCRLGSALVSSPSVREALETGASAENVAAAANEAGCPVSASTVRSHRREACACYKSGEAGAAPVRDSVDTQGSAAPSGDHPAGWRPKSAWQGPDGQWRYSYAADTNADRLEPVSEETYQSWRAALIRDRAPEPQPVSAPAGTYTMMVADPQLGKKGTEEAVENWKRGVREHVAAARLLGDDVEAVHIAFMGDETEGVCNNYTNQPHTIELNQSQQLELDYDLRVWTIREAAKLGKRLSVSSVISNHGEWTRNGGKDPVTTQSDNASTHIARQVRKLFRELEPFGGPEIDWTIGEGEPGVVVELSGERVYFSHGYVEKGRGSNVEARTKSAIERQILGRTAELGSVRLWIMAHYHHFYTNEFEGRTLFGCPALEAEKSSEYMLEQFGVWSPPGMLGMLIGADARGTSGRGWANLNVY